MSDVLRKAKNHIRQDLDVAVKAAVSESASPPISSGVTQSVCNVIEAVFIHGLKDAFFQKGSRYSKYPEPFSHRSIKNQITGLNQIKNEIGKARAWIRIVLNDGVLEHYIQIFCKDRPQLCQFYAEDAFLRDAEKVETLVGYLKALVKIDLDAPINSSFLNSWTPTPLILAGLIKGKAAGVPSPKQEPLKDPLGRTVPRVESGLSVRSRDEEDRSSVYSHPELLDAAPAVPHNSPWSGLADGALSEVSSEVTVLRRKGRLRRTSKSSSERSLAASRSNSSQFLSREASPAPAPSQAEHVISPEKEAISEPLHLNSHELASSSESPADNPTSEPIPIGVSLEEELHMLARSEEQAVRSPGNSLLAKCWDLRRQSTELELSESLGTDSSGQGSLVPFAEALKNSVRARRDSEASRRSAAAAEEERSTSGSSESGHEDVVVIEEQSLLEEDEAAERRKLLGLLTRIPRELGLDAQGFRCPACHRSIGAAFGPFRLCALDGRNYCEACFQKAEESAIPARILLNWDHRPRPVSSLARGRLREVYDRPLVHVDRVNPALYAQAPALERVRALRVKLSLVAMYLISCKQSVAEDLKRRLWPNGYLYTDVHLYSVKDLENVAAGVLERRLRTVIAFAVDHVASCMLCVQKGFVCELCNSRKVIYPFETESVHRCSSCFSVFHRHCMLDRAGCPRCERHAENQRRLNAMERF